MSIIYALLAGLFSSITAILAKLGVESGAKVDPILETTIRFLFSFITLVFILLLSTHRSKADFTEITGIDWFYIILSGIAFGISSAFFYLSLDTGETSIVVAIERMSIVLTLILSIMFLGEHFTIPKAIGISCIVLGVLILNIK